jgi:hypothetical protein
MQKMPIYFFDYGTHLELIPTNYAMKHNVLNTPIITKKNEIFKDSMKLTYSTRYGKHLYLTSTTTNIRYPLFRSEFKYILEMCKMDKLVIDPIDWTIRNHSGLYSIKLAY